MQLPPGQLSRDQGDLEQVLKPGEKEAIFLGARALHCPICFHLTGAPWTFVFLSERGGRGREEAGEEILHSSGP